MNYEIAVSPELNLNVKEIVASWNASPEAKAVATAQVKESDAVNYGDPITLTVVLVGMVVTVTTTVLTNVLTKVIEEKLLPKEKTPKAPAFKITATTLASGTTMLVVEQAE